MLQVEYSLAPAPATFHQDALTSELDLSDIQVNLPWRCEILGRLTKEDDTTIHNIWERSCTVYHDTTLAIPWFFPEGKMGLLLIHQIPKA